MNQTPVVDLGCHAHPAHPGASQDSVAELIRRFRPPSLYGFDPHPDLVEGKTRVGFPGRDVRWNVGRTTVTRTRAAAWTYDGMIAYDPHPDQPLRASVGHGALDVRCFDLARWLAGRRVIVKMDVEGAEYPLLEHVCAHGRDVNIERLLVEWHPVDGWQERRADLLAALRCEVEDWEPVSA